MLSPLTDPQLASDLAERGRHRDLARRPAAHAVPRPGHGRADLAGQRGRLQGRAGRRGGVRPVLPAADHRGGHRAAREAARARHRRGGPAGDRHGRRLGAQVSGYDVRPASKGEVESLGATFIELTSVRQRGGRGRLRPRAHRRGAGRAAGRAGRAHRPAGRGDHHRAGAGPAPAAAGHRGRGAPMSAGSVIVDMGASPLGGNVAGSVAGETVVTAERCHDHRGARTWRPPCPTAASNAYSRNISALLLHLVGDGDAGDRHHRRDPGGGRRHARRRGRAPRRRETARRRTDPEPRELAMSTALVTDLTIFVLALLVGIEVIGKVPATLHTPLMSAANSIHGIVLAGALLIGAHRAQRRRVRAGVRRRVLRRRERGRRLRGDRPDAQDVPPQGGAAAPAAAPCPPRARKPRSRRRAASANGHGASSAAQPGARS